MDTRITVFNDIISNESSATSKSTNFTQRNTIDTFIQTVDKQLSIIVKLLLSGSKFGIKFGDKRHRMLRETIQNLDDFSLNLNRRHRYFKTFNHWFPYRSNSCFDKLLRDKRLEGITEIVISIFRTNAIINEMYSISPLVKIVFSLYIVKNVSNPAFARYYNGSFVKKEFIRFQDIF